MDLTTSYLGLKLKNPIIVSSSPLTASAEKAQTLEAAGVAAVVVNSIFEEQIRDETSQMDEALAADGSSEAYDYLRANIAMRLGPEKYVDDIRAIKETTSIPVIASINCISADNWVSFARKIEAAGADALELNLYDIPQDPNETSNAVEERHLKLVSAIRAEIDLPIAVKLSPYYTNLLNFAHRLDKIGINGIVMFNRFLQPDIDIESETLRHAANLSREQDLRLPLRWVAILRNHLRCDIAINSGIHNAEGVIKGMLAGANVAYLCSALYHNRDHAALINGIINNISGWMQRKNYPNLAAFHSKMCELSTDSCKGFERAHYVKILTSQK